MAPLSGCLFAINNHSAESYKEKHIIARCHIRIQCAPAPSPIYFAKYFGVPGLDIEAIGRLYFNSNDPCCQYFKCVYVLLLDKLLPIINHKYNTDRDIKTLDISNHTINM